MSPHDQQIAAPKDGIVAVLLAAGSSERMGADKLLLPFEGRPLIRHAVDALMKSAAVGEIVVVVRPGFVMPAEASELSSRLRVVENPRHAEGMGTSLRAGVEAASGSAGAYLFMLADMPLIGLELIDRVVEAWHAAKRPIVAPVYEGRRGHPVVVSASLRTRLLACGGDQGLRGLIRDDPSLVEEMVTDDPSCIFDVDRLQDLVPRARVLIKGAGEHASGTAHRLFQSGFQVMMTEIERPTAVRRKVSFCQAVFDGEARVEGVSARRTELSEISADASVSRRLCLTHIPVVVDPCARLREIWRPDVVIDARIMKRNLDTRLDDAPLVIGYGPGFVAGEDVHAVVETMRGHDLGRIIFEGAAAPNTGVPGPIAGESSRRLLSAPAAGTVRAHRAIGDLVESGTIICEVAGREVRAEIGGVLRGLVIDGLEVFGGQKIGDIDPRGEARYCHTISEKARCISGAALELVLSRGRSLVG